MPSPPTCISVKMTHWPNKVNTLPVSTTPSPVTVQAETVVNKASSHEMDVVVAIGNFNRHVPIIDSIIKDTVRTRGGLMLMLIRFISHIVPFDLLLLVCEEALLCMLKKKRQKRSASKP